jgi:hypothetical protein
VAALAASSLPILVIQVRSADRIDGLAALLQKQPVGRLTLMSAAIVFEGSWLRTEQGCWVLAFRWR